MAQDLGLAACGPRWRPGRKAVAAPTVMLAR